MTAEPRLVLHHTALEHRGGAVGVARLLLAAQRGAGIEAWQSFEVPEPEMSGPDSPSAPQQAGAANSDTPPRRHAPAEELGVVFTELAGNGLDEAVLHLHGSTDWTAMLSSVLWEYSQTQARPRLLLTLHDARPLTGGCAYPLDCPYFPFGCVDPCPRDFPDVAAGQGELLGLLVALAEAAPLTLASPSRWLAEQAQAVLADMPLKIIPNGVPWPTARELTPRPKARALLGLPPEARVALFAAHGGAKAAYKSGSEWPRYWAELTERLPGLALRGLALGGDEAGTTPEGLTLWPYVDRAKLNLAMRAADVFVYPTLADNHPLVLLEAAAQELPVVSYSVGGVPEIIAHGATGLLVPPGDRAALLDAAASLLDSPMSARRMGNAAYDHGAKRFHTQRMGADYARLLAG